MFRTQQLFVFAGMAAAVIVIFLAAQNLAAMSFVPLPFDDTADRLAFALKWLLVPGLCLFAGIGMAANRRFFLPDAMEGSRSPENRFLEINLRYNQNTLEQTVLAAIAWTGLALVLPLDRLALIPMLAFLFAVGRITFWIGYLIAPAARAFGLGLTFYPTAGALLYLGWRALG